MRPSRRRRLHARAERNRLIEAERAARCPPESAEVRPLPTSSPRSRASARMYSAEHSISRIAIGRSGSEPSHSTRSSRGSSRRAKRARPPPCPGHRVRPPSATLIALLPGVVARSVHAGPPGRPPRSPGRARPVAGRQLALEVSVVDEAPENRPWPGNPSDPEVVFDDRVARPRNHRQDAAREGVEGAAVTDPLRRREPAYERDDVVGRRPSGL